MPQTLGASLFGLLPATKKKINDETTLTHGKVFCTMSTPVKICVTGGAGQIAYSLIFDIARGSMLGPDQPVILHLLDIEPMMDKLNGVVLELEDCAFPLLSGVVASCDPKEGFSGVSYAILVGAMPRREGMVRADLLKANCGIFKTQGSAIQDHANPDVKVLVVGNPANTNALICMTSAPKLPRENFTALTRLDHNRALNQIAKKAGVPVTSVGNVIIWGNHSKTQYPDVNHGFVALEGSRKPIKDVVSDKGFLEGEFITTVQQRGATVIGLRKLSSAASAAKAIVDHMRTWVLGTAEGEIVSMGVPSDGSYGIEEGVIYSYPVTCKHGKYTIVKDLPIDEFSRKKMDETAAELFEEKEAALKFLSS